ncbi:hypothetical protein [Candidatus Binatus sp.]|jgi:transposase|uniref:hypothetical protein n=1 Tax=Candidatus Binatus sp. TaxID=2811406 RepID=UPI003C598726
MARGRGQPTKLTPEISKRICDAIKAGATIEVAAQAVRLSKRVLYLWKALGEQQTSGKYFQFLQDIKTAAAEEEIAGVAEIYAASRPGLIERVSVTTKEGVTTTREKFSRGDWTARAWIMERRHRRRWGRDWTVDLDKENDSTVDANAERQRELEELRLLSPEQITQLRIMQETIDAGIARVTRSEEMVGNGSRGDGAVEITGHSVRLQVTGLSDAELEEPDATDAESSPDESVSGNLK